MRFTYPHEAYAIRTAMEESGIQTFLCDELTIQTDNFLSNAIGGVKLQVPEDKAEQAYDILRRTGYLEGSETGRPKTSQIRIFNDSGYDKTLCPLCHSENIVKKKIPTLWIVVFFFLLYLPLPLFKKRYYCYDCRREWKYKRK